METVTEVRKEKESIDVLFVGSLVQATLGAFAIALSIIALAAMRPFLSAVAVIAIGASLLFEGGSIAYRFTRLLQQTSIGIMQGLEFGEGVSAEFIGGVAGIVLGILALLNIVPIILISVSAIVYGTALMLGAGVTTRLNHLIIQGSNENELSQKVARGAVTAAAGVQVFIGLAGATLGIIGVVGIERMSLGLVAMLVLAFGRLLTGTALSNRMLYFIYK
jgi:hypothetical protein